MTPPNAIGARERLPALAALALPVLVGVAWMASAGAPASYAIVNLGALVLAGGWVLFGLGPHTAASRHILAIAAIALMLMALVVGAQLISITGHPVQRWFPVGPLNAHTGMVAAPILAVLAARDPRAASFVILAGIIAAWLQPDAATGFALTFAAIGLHHVTQDWRAGVAGIIAFVASLEMAMRGELPPQPFVERVVADAAATHLLLGFALVASVIGSFCLILFASPLARAARFALAGALFGFAIMALMSSYPAPLLGYGPSAIIGFGLALGMVGPQDRSKAEA